MFYLAKDAESACRASGIFILHAIFGAKCVF